MPHISKKRKIASKPKSMCNNSEFLNRISKSLYYSKLPVTECLSLPVTELAAELFNEVKNGRTLERLDVERANRISKNACVSPCVLVLALLYLERLKNCNPEYLQQVAPSELFIVSLMVASKFLNDEGEDDEVFNTEWAQSGDLTVSQINQLEMDFLKAIDWTIFVNKQDFWERLQKLEKEIAYKEARKRGWFSYTELCCLMNTMQLLNVAHTMVNVSSICLATYTAGIVTLLGSALVASCVPGTVLCPRQSTNSTDMTKTDFNSVIDTTSPIEVLSENVSISDFASTHLTCNQSQQNNENIETDGVTDVSWKWWLNPMMIWLPEYSDLKSRKTLNIANNETEHAETLRTTIFLLYFSILDAFLISMGWKQLSGVDFRIPFHNRRYYMNYDTKITLDQH